MAGRKRALTEEQLIEAAKLHKDGMKAPDIAKMFYISPAVLWKRWKELGIDYKQSHNSRARMYIQKDLLKGFIKDMQIVKPTSEQMIKNLIEFYEKETRTTF